MHITYLSMCVQSLSSVRLFVTPWTVARHAPLSMRFSGQEYWSGLPYPPSGDIPNPEIKPGSLTLKANSLPSEPPEKPITLEGVSKKILLQFMSECSACVFPLRIL